VEVLEIVAGPLALSFLGEDLAVPATLSSVMNAWEILEEQAGAAQACQQGAIVISGQRVKACLHIGEVLPEQRGHVVVEPGAVRQLSWTGRSRCGDGRLLNRVDFGLTTDPDTSLSARTAS